MNGIAHQNILRSAFSVQPEELQEHLVPVEAANPQASNYPDIFDDPTKPETEKDILDPDWRSFCLFPENMDGRNLHAWPHPNTKQTLWRPVTEHLLSRAVGAWRNDDLTAFVKFIGCMSHFFGDTTQPAHIADLEFIEQLMPAPSSMQGFHYHTGMEAVTGECGVLRPPQLLGLCVEETAWRVANMNTRAMRECRCYIVPLLQAIFEGDTNAAIKHAGPPVTIAAQLTADLTYTAWRLATGSISTSERNALASVDLRLWLPDDSKHDSVYGDAILDGNRATPPGGAPIVPARIRSAYGELRIAKGLGMLPHSGMWGVRECYVRYELPPALFESFEAEIGMNADITTAGAVYFVIERDDREVFHSRRMTATSPAMPVSLRLGAGRTLTLKVVDANDGKTFWNNHAFWAEPRLVRISTRIPRILPPNTI
jgi:hypothetical protein